MKGRWSIISSAFLFIGLDVQAQNAAEVRELSAKAIDRTSLKGLSRIAFESKSEWKHSETANFFYHSSDGEAVGAVAAEAEFFYRVIASELFQEAGSIAQKAHIFLFANEKEWAAFQSRGLIDPRTGGIQSEGALFLKRRGAAVYNDATLAHEIAHLVLARSFGSGIPLWLNEGFAENASIRCRSAYFRARGYDAAPRYRGVPADSYIPLSELMSFAAYPADTLKLHTFYDESEKLVRFLLSADKKAFVGFLGSISKGVPIEAALSRNYGARFIDLRALEREFKPFATSKQHPAGGG